MSIQITEDQRHQAKRFLQLFEAIPEDRWVEHEFHNPEATRFCALGHLGARIWMDHYPGPAKEFNDLMTRVYGYKVPDINDGCHPEFDQQEPKARVVAALRKIVE